MPPGNSPHFGQQNTFFFRLMFRCRPREPGASQMGQGSFSARSNGVSAGSGVGAAGAGVSTVGGMGESVPPQEISSSSFTAGPS